jgi:hypothetical protein
MYGLVEPEGVRLTWQTAQEVLVQGFNVLRQAEGGEREQVNGDFIFAQHAGGDQGADYEFVDRSVASGVTYEYLLEVKLSDGLTVYHPLAPVTTKWWANLPLVAK